MNIPDHILESLETIFWVKKVILDPRILLTLDPEGKFGYRIRNTGSATLVASLPSLFQCCMA